MVATSDTVCLALHRTKFAAVLGNRSDVLRRQGAGGQWTSQCVCYMLSQHDVVRSGIACGLLEGWLTSEGSARKVTPLPDHTPTFISY